MSFLLFLFCRIIKEKLHKGDVPESTNSTFNRCTHMSNIKSCEFFPFSQFYLFKSLITMLSPNMGESIKCLV
ncbi:hypothetical protein MtrunA17_Chr7g0216371 [Medicago truncatula]|uniref:Uncharacterized protein n=1 Tax=Medicago truncatula TaxID=3880 RepID=A0A396GSL9_MEDTR|nr:hypothetical protein MtrunA17_Chr7g0216371 [Medicago truncatula]